MYTQNGRITFEKSDLKFLQKHGLSKAVVIYEEHCAHSNLPFVTDHHQLAGLLGCYTNVLFQTLRTVDELYYDAAIPKATGGYRTLQVPTYPLRCMQTVILRSILDKLPVSPYATAYHKGARITDNAKPHQHKKYLLKMDLQDFFSSITFEQVLSSVFHKGRFPTHVGVSLTALCCKNGVLPQGAPTSPALSNLVMSHFDGVMGEWCRRQGFSYTRYCDDITVSGNRPLYAAYQKAKGLLENMGFELNEKKTRFVTAAHRQTVTGLTVNQGIGVTADYKRNLRQAVYYTVKFGAADHIRQRNLTRFMVNGVPQTERYLAHLEGQIRYVLSVEPDNRAMVKLLADLSASPPYMG